MLSMLARSTVVVVVVVVVEGAGSSKGASFKERD